MIKKILLGSLMLLSLHSFAQESTASPYSFYGLGEVKFKGTVENKSMGGLGILPDSIHTNLQNPAALSALKLTLFSVAGTYNTQSLKTESASEKARRTSLDYIAMAFPAGKLGLTLGMMPYSSVGYKIRYESPTDVKDNKGKGGVNRVFVGAGYQLTSKISVGLDFGYNFGKIETTTAVFPVPAIQNGSRELNTSVLNGINFNAGAIYKTKIKKYDFITSATFSPEANIKSSNTRNTATITYDSQGNEIVIDPRDVSVADSDLKMPSKFSFGSGIGEIRKWFVGFETTFQGKREFGNAYAEKASFESSSKFSLGGYYVPNYNSFTNYFNKITYRGGLRYENTGLVVNSQSIKDRALTLGLGLPINGSFSNINIGFEFGKRGTTVANLVQENYFNVSVGLSFNDRWFVKRKYD
ncbi:outer membrane beta-barrel protein [Flavobacterium humi]|uniref:Outer membrane protein beta-barrel domain-containing protein n=1 Tax=Flavobacterium humi TaxID=2562683 RepID=A0A4Z0L8P4_9FLAO|nr:hypothetical protein [Flavobacterium humi]TGD57339.1 hypothetical protein E4635_12020 [Flavobacterium humi]